MVKMERERESSTCKMYVMTGKSSPVQQLDVGHRVVVVMVVDDDDCDAKIEKDIRDQHCTVQE